MIKTRFSPSPTGLLHLGNVRAALFSALYAKKMQGHFILRIEDTDQARSSHEFTAQLQDDLQWLGMEWQEGPKVGGPHGPYWQSERHAIYANYYQQLEESGRAYPCFCSDQELALNRKIQLSRGQAPRYPGTCRSLSKEEIAKRIHEGKKPALRFQVSTHTKIEFTDLVKGPQQFLSDDIGDFIIRRADGSSSFMFCNAIDDSLMGVTHVLRGEDHLTNTPRQLMILSALTMRAAEYGHLSLITGDDGSPLSKRHGSFSLNDLRTQGFLPVAVLNYLARLSHTYDQQRLLSFSELAEQFDLTRLSRSSARFDKNQLLHWQKEAVLAQDLKTTWNWLAPTIEQSIPFEKRELFTEIMRQNILFPQEAHKWMTILLTQDMSITPEHIAILKEAGEVFFNTAFTAVEEHQTDLTAVLNNVKNTLSVSGKRLFMPIRIALTGEPHGPELVHIASLLGVDEMKRRFAHARELAR